MIGDGVADHRGRRVLGFTNGKRNRVARRHETGQQRPQFLKGIRLKLRKS